jgi:hypothetical protein
MYPRIVRHTAFIGKVALGAEGAISALCKFIDHSSFLAISEAVSSQQWAVSEPYETDCSRLIAHGS